MAAIRKVWLPRIWALVAGLVAGGLVGYLAAWITIAGFAVAVPATEDAATAAAVLVAVCVLAGAVLVAWLSVRQVAADQRRSGYLRMVRLPGSNIGPNQEN